MNEGGPCGTPLLDLLRRVPEEAHEWRQDGLGWHNIPYGSLSHRAIAEIERLQANTRVMAGSIRRLQAVLDNVCGTFVLGGTAEELANIAEKRIHGLQKGDK